jgi:hypothetical protein
VAENARPPVAVRIVRPYETEESFLESELETVGKTSIILIGAHPRPSGVILRFEVTLASGATVLRGEGRVLAHKESAFRGQPGLALRFTRLDPKSKALVDRAAAIREARLAGDPTRLASTSSPPPAPLSAPASLPPVSIEPSMPPAAPQDPTSSPSDPGLAQMLTSATPPPPALEGTANGERRPSMAPEAGGTSTVPPDGRVEARGHTPPPPPRVSAHTDEPNAPSETATEHALATIAPGRPAPSTVPPAGSEGITGPPAAREDTSQSLSRPDDRDALLSRLRQRAASLTDERKAAILRSS